MIADVTIPSNGNMGRREEEKCEEGEEEKSGGQGRRGGKRVRGGGNSREDVNVRMWMLCHVRM